eukprot:jgi/Psemu1/329005/estExt_fgenesh1_pg.C_52240001
MISHAIKGFGPLRPWLPGLVGLGAAYTYHININIDANANANANIDATDTTKNKNNSTSANAASFDASRYHSSNKPSESSTVSFRGNRQRRAVVIGAGVAGISTAYELYQNGFEVIVVDASMGGPGAECSAVAAGGMQRSNPVVDGKKWRSILSNLWSSASGSAEFRYFYIDWVQTLTDPHFLRWSVSFAYNSLVQPKALLYQQEEMLKFTDWAIAQFALDRTLAQIVDESQIAPRGALMLNATKYSEHCKEENEEKLHTATNIHAIEPFVKKFWPNVSRAVYQPDARSGNSERFTKALAQWLEKKDDVRFLYQTPVKGLHYQGNRVTAIELENKIRIELDEHGDRDRDSDCDGDEIVIAAGSWTPKLLWQLNEYVPVYPLKGYCLEL